MESTNQNADTTDIMAMLRKHDATEDDEQTPFILPDDSEQDSKLKTLLLKFYNQELQNESEDYSVRRRQKEAMRRAKRTFNFYKKYKYYEEQGFPLAKVKDIFGIPVADQRFLLGWLKKTLPQGLATTTYAEQGMGKSNTASFIAELVLILKPQWDIVTNVSYSFSPRANMLEDTYDMPRIKIVGSMSAMLREIAQTIINKRVPAVIIDEMDSSYVATQTKSNRGISFKSFIYVERHFGTKGPFLIYHRRKDIPVEMRQNNISLDTYQVAWYRNYNTGRSKRVLSNPDLWWGQPEGYRYLPIPLTRLPYMNQGFGSFAIDVNMQAISESLNGTQEQAAFQMLELMNEFQTENQGRRRNLRTPD